MTPLLPPTSSHSDDVTAHPLYDSNSKRAIPTYVFRQEHPSWLLPVAKDKRSRTGGDYQEYFARFVEDVRARGVQQPIIAVRRGEFGEPIDGETRRLAALLAGLNTIPILLYEQELSESDLVIAQLQANAQRRDFSEIELAAIYIELMRLNGWNQATLAKNIQVSAGQVSRILSISQRLSEAARLMVEAGELAPRAAYALSKITDVAMQLELANKFKSGQLCVEGIEAQVGKLMGKKTGKQKPVKVSLGGVTVIIEVGDLQKILSMLAVLDAAIRKAEKHALPISSLPQLLKQ